MGGSEINGGFEIEGGNSGNSTLKRLVTAL